MYLEYVLKLVSYSNYVVNDCASLATEHPHNIPHDTTKVYTECEAFTSLE